MWLVFQEAEIVVDRINHDLVTTALLTQGAIISCLDKKGGKSFQKMIASLGGKTEDVKAVPKTRQPVVKGPVDPRIPKRKNKARQPIPQRRKS